LTFTLSKFQYIDGRLHLALSGPSKDPSKTSNQVQCIRYKVVAENTGSSPRNVIHLYAAPAYQSIAIVAGTCSW